MDQTVRVESTSSVLTSGATRGQSLSIPINHFEGNYTCDDATLDALRANDQIILTYADNPNGSVGDVAGWITPVPGGVGPMTVATLLENTLLAAELHEQV